MTANEFPSVSVIMVNWNGRKWLKRCLDSLLGQTSVKLEIIIVDNASTDDSVEFVSRDYPFVKLIESNNNIGFAGGNNLGCSVATHPWIAFLNNDTWLETGAISSLVDFAIDSKLDVVGAAEVGYDNDTPYHSGRFLIDYFGHPVLAEKVNSIKCFYFSAVCLVTKKTTYRETGGFDNDFFMYFEETDWFWRLHLYGKNIALHPNVTVHHAGHGSTGGLTKLDYSRFLWRNQNCLQMLLKNHSSFDLIWTLPVYFLINVIEALAFLSIGEFCISQSYLKGWSFNLKMLNKTLKKRAQIKKSTNGSNQEISRKFYKGSSKFIHLISR